MNPNLIGEPSVDYTYSSTATDTSGAMNGAVAGTLLFFTFIMVIAAYAIGAFLLGRVFKKAGVPQWAAWVPVYNSWKLLEIGDQQGFWAILSFIPFVNIVAAIFLYISMYNIGLKLQKSGWFVLLAIFLPLIWLIWLGFDDSKWPAEKNAAPKKAPAAKKPTRKKAA